MVLSCTQSSDCPFLYNCISKICKHQDVFAGSAMSICAYILLPILLMFSNVGGHSAGVFKVPILINLLNYTIGQATPLTYPMVTGASLFNIMLLIPKRHPTKHTSLIDYNVALILLPSVIYGTTLAVLYFFKLQVNFAQYIPSLYINIITIVYFTAFTVFFIKKYRHFG